MDSQQRSSVPVPCPPFEGAELVVSGSAPLGHFVVDGFTVIDHVWPVENCPVCVWYQLLNQVQDKT